MSPKRVLFICQHNSARSQMAEEFLRQLGGDAFVSFSAGLEPTAINPLVIEIMKEEGIDLSAKTTTDVFELYRDGQLFEYVITVCSNQYESKCPLFPGVTTRLNWPFPDPSKAEGSHEQKLKATRKISDSIKSNIEKFIADFS